LARLTGYFHFFIDDHAHSFSLSTDSSPLRRSTPASLPGKSDLHLPPFAHRTSREACRRATPPTPRRRVCLSAPTPFARAPSIAPRLRGSLSANLFPSRPRIDSPAPS